MTAICGLNRSLNLAKHEDATVKSGNHSYDTPKTSILMLLIFHIMFKGNKAISSV